MQNKIPLVEAKHLQKTFEKKTAFTNINLSIFKGEVLALVGESGSGKSTFGKTLLSLEKPTQGSVFFDGIDITKLSYQSMRQMRRRMQIIFQNPAGSLNPRMTIREIIDEARDIHQLSRSRTKELMHLVKLEPELLDSYPHQLSGGQCQRVSIARALAVEPEFIVCDEPLSALDMLIRKQILLLLKNLHREMNLTYLFITHDLSTLDNFADRIAVMYLGNIVEVGTTYEILNHPKHPYTQALLQNCRTHTTFFGGM